MLSRQSAVDETNTDSSTSPLNSAGVCVSATGGIDLHDTSIRNLYFSFVVYQVIQTFRIRCIGYFPVEDLYFFIQVFPYPLAHTISPDPPQCRRPLMSECYLNLSRSISSGGSIRPVTSRQHQPYMVLSGK